MSDKIIEEFRKKYKDYLGCAYEEIPNRNLGDEMVFDILKALSQQKAEIKKIIEEVIEDIKLEKKVFYCELNQFELLSMVIKKLKKEIDKL